MYNPFENILNWLERKKVEKKSGWIAWLVAAAIALVAIAVLALKVWSRSHELSKLKHKADILEEKKEAAEADKVIQGELFNQTQLDFDIEVIKKEKIEVESSIETVQNDRLKYKNKINAIKTWDEVDKL